MAKVYVIKGTAVVPNPNTTEPEKRIIQGTLWTFTSPNHNIEVYASINSLSHSFSTKNQFTIMNVDTLESMDVNTDDMYGVISTSSVSLQPVVTP